MQTADYSLSKHQVYVIPFFRNYINFMMLFFPLMSFLLIPAIQGTTITTILAGILFGILFSVPERVFKKWFLKDFAVFLGVFLFFSVSSQYLNLLFNLKLTAGLELVDKGNLLNSFFRPTHLTQALYLTMSFITYLFVKYYADISVIRYIYFGLRILCFYGIYEILFFQLTGTKGDFVTNRTFSDVEGSGSLAQTMQVAGFIVLRMKSFTGEPSMFAFTVFPFWALTHVIKRKFDNLLLLSCLVLTFSTTAYASILLFQIGWFFYKKRYKQLIYILALLLLFLMAMQIDVVREKVGGIYETVFESKLSGNSSSKQDREGLMMTHFNFWTKLNIPNQLFGVGFGYIRSTDFFTTILVNCGLLGLITFTCFFFKCLVKIKLPNPDLHFCYFLGLAILFLIFMLTVPEFMYPSMWIYLALWYVLSKQNKIVYDE